MPDGISSPAKAKGSGSTLARIAASPRLAPAILAILVAWELLILPLAAGRTFFWYDELFTVHVSTLKPFSLIWKALYEGADGMTPPFHAILQVVRVLPLDPMVTLRIPSILGYLLTLCGVYWFTRKRLTGSASLVAVLLIALSPFRGYALEARCYALFVGLLAVAACFWQRIGEKPRFVPLFGVVLAMAVSCHHLAVASISIFGFAELVWSLLNRRVRWGVWIACVLAGAPFLISVPIAMHYREAFGTHFWSLPKWGTFLSTYQLYLGGEVNWALILSLLLVGGVLFALPGVLRRHRAREAEAGFSLPELALICAFAIYPAWLVLLAMAGRSGYVPRYGLPAMIGLALGVVYLLRPVWRHGHAVVLPGALLIFFLVRAGFEVSWVAEHDPRASTGYWAKLIEISRQEPNIPIVVTPSSLYLEADEYAPAELKSRLVNVVDSESSVRFTGTDTLDRSNQVLARFIPLHVVQLGSFQAGNPKFILFAGPAEFDWLTPYLKQHGVPLKPIVLNADLSLYIAGR
ncbi:hypothetical protein [Paludibaculum fermentans]|uniref:hypothetical protein n=1 Tax=Paludibaculum fermentans TaxID=1473598 RepID=UPI003EB9A862